jgi:hypothetical protein
MRIDLGDRAIAENPDPRCGEHAQPFEGALGAQLLHDADRRVRHEHDAEQRVLERTDDRDDHQHRPEQRVEPGEHVGPDDPADRSGRHRGDVVDVPARHPHLDLGGG